MRARALHLLLATTAGTLAASAAHAVNDVALPRLLASPEPVAYDIFGSDLAVATPSILAAGVRGADGFGLNAGAVELFERGAKGWTFRERLAAPGVASGDQLGETVAAGGGWIFAAATRHDAIAGDAGAVWVYRAVGSGWVYAQTLLPTGAAAGARFGSAIAVDGGVAAIGAPGSGGGEVRVFELVKGQWTATATIAIPTGNPFNRFGDAVTLSGGRLFVGDPNDDVGAYDGGAVFVYEKVAGAWSLVATLRAATPEVRGNFGRSVSANAGRVAIGVPGAAAPAGDGAPVAAAGRVDLFGISGGVFTPSGSLSPAPASAVVGGNFGWSVALEGVALVVGAPGEAVSGGAGGDVARAGRTAVYAQASGGAWNPVLSLALDAPAANEVLGTSVALSGGVLAIGAPGAMLQGSVKGAAIAFALDADCDSDGLPDDLEILLGAGDCDADGVPDACERDIDEDGVPDACECPYDLDGDGQVGATDLAIVLAAWGAVGPGTPPGADFNSDGLVNAVDLTVVLGYWGSCGG